MFSEHDATPGRISTLLRQSCDLCYKRRKRCDGKPGSPCSACAKKKIACRFSERDKMGPKRVRSWRSDNESDDRTTLTALQMHHNAEYHETVANSSRDSPNHRNPQRHRQATAEQQQSTLLRHPAPHAQQLLGARERNFLQTYYIAFKGLDLKDDELPRAALRLLTHGASGTGRAMLYGCEGKVGLMPPGQLLRAIIASAGESMLWTAVAFGAVLRNPAYLSQAEPYAVCAMATLSACRRLPPDISPPLAVLHAHVMLSGLCLVLEQIPMAARVFAGALWTAGAIVSAEKTPEATPGEMHSESLAHAAMLALDENTWMVLESRRLFLAFAAACLDPVSAQRMPQVEGLCDGEPGKLFSILAPQVGLLSPGARSTAHGVEQQSQQPDATAFNTGAPAQQTERISPVQLATLPRFVAIKRAMQLLCEPSPPAIPHLVLVATGQYARLEPILLSTLAPIAQIMAMVVSAPPGADLAPAALEAGAKLLRLRERVVASIGDDALSSGTAFCMACDLVFLRLLIGHEDGALDILLKLVLVINTSPGLLRLTLPRHEVHCFAALLLSAGLRSQHDALVRTYNAVELAGGRDKLPQDEEGRVCMSCCRELRCAAVHRTVANNLMRGAAHIFVRYTLLHLKSNAAPTIDLSRASLLMGMGGRFPMPKTGECPGALDATARAADAAGAASAAGLQESSRTSSTTTAAVGIPYLSSSKSVSSAASLLPSCAHRRVATAVEDIGGAPVSRRTQVLEHQQLALKVPQVFQGSGSRWLIGGERELQQSPEPHLEHRQHTVLWRQCQQPSQQQPQPPLSESDAATECALSTATARSSALRILGDSSDSSCSRAPALSDAADTSSLAPQSAKQTLGDDALLEALECEVGLDTVLDLATLCASDQSDASVLGPMA